MKNADYKLSYIDATGNTTKIGLNVNKIFTAQDYRLTFLIIRLNVEVILKQQSKMLNGTLL